MSALSFSRIAILVCFLACLANLYLASESEYGFVYVDESGLHYRKSGESFLKKRFAALHNKLKRRHHSTCRPRDHNPHDGLVETLLEHHAQEFCSTFLHIKPFATTTTATQTSTTSEFLATQTTTTTTTTDLGTTTVPTTVTETSTTIVTDATVTDTLTDTSTSTSTSTTTTTTFLHTAPHNNGLSRRGEDDIPPWLHHFPASQISSACSHIVTPKTKTATTTTTTTAPLTASVTVTTTTTIPQVTEPTTTTTTTTSTLSVTETDTTTTTTTTATTTTATAVATQCAQSRPIDGGGIGADGGQLNFFQDPSPDACCTRCWTGTGCGLWFFFPGFGCFNANNANGPNPTAQCPTGDGHYIIIPGTPGDPNVGGEGPCSGGLVG